MNDLIFVVTLVSIVGVVLIVSIIIALKIMFKPQKMTTILDMVKQGRIQQAIRAAKKLVEANPRNMEAHYILGKAYEQEQRYELAFVEYKQCNSISDFKGICKEIPFRKSMAKLFRLSNEQEEALKEYLLLTKLDVDDIDNYFQVAQIFEERGKIKQAAAYYKKTIQIDETHVEAYFRLGVLLYNAQKNGDAQLILKKALKLNPQNDKIYYYLGKIYVVAKDYLTAVSCFDKSQRDPDFKIRSIVEKGLCYLKQDNMDKARTDFERAVKLVDSGQIKASRAERLAGRYYLAQCYEQARDVDAAIEQWKLIYAEKPGYMDVAEKLSRYQDLSSDDFVKDFMTVNTDEFLDMCSDVTVSLGFSVNEITGVPSGCQVIAVESQSGQWLNVKKMPRLIRFIRTADIIEVDLIRKFLEDLKMMNVTRGMIICSSTFSRTAMEFAESRPVELYGRDKLQELLKKHAKKKKRKS